MTISKLKDLIGLKVLFKVEYDEFQQEVIGFVSNAYLDDFYFNEKWNEPIYTRVRFSPAEENEELKKIDEDEYNSIFEDEYSLEDILKILN